MFKPQWQSNYFLSFSFLLILSSFLNLSARDNAILTVDQTKPYWQTRIPYQGEFQSGAIRQVFLLNKNWDYLEENFSSINDLDDPDFSWEKVNLPHTWNAFDATDNDPGYRRDASWYCKEIMIPDFDDPLIFRLYFEGVNISCEVYVNGQKAGSHVGGYVGFTVDITPFIQKGTVNRIDVCADNSINPDIIPSQKSDFFIFGGITRDVWLKILSATFIDQIQISTPKVTEKLAETSVLLTLVHKKEKNQTFELEVGIKNPEGKIVTRKSVPADLKPGKNTVSINLPTVKKPALWSPENPNLYEMTARLKSNRIVDEVSERFGYRWFEFKEQGPFYLNGKRLLLRGTHRHEDHAGFGNALPDSLHRNDMKMIKEMGANFVRLAHYPQDPEIYRACDELGLLVWDELPWCRGGMGKEVWESNTKRLLKEQILQNYNHPSIILWSLGNELYWLPDFPGGDNIDSLKAFVTELNDLAHQLDPGRLTTMRKFYDGAEITDVFSPSIWAGWYSGVYKTYEKALTSSRMKYKRFIHAEYGGSSHVGRYTENPITGEGLVKEDEWAEQPNMINIEKISEAGDWSENYIVDLFDWHLMISEQLDWFTGNAQWAFKDFATPLRPENPIPYMNQKGLVDRAGNPKDAYYVFKSYWTKVPKFCYIESPTWTERTGKPGEIRQICVYSNCDQVQLVLNDEKQGLKNRNINDFPACGFHWDVLFKEGKNQLIAIGFADGKKVTSNFLSINYSNRKNGKPEEIKLSSKKLSNGNYLVQARVVDSQGQLCLDYNKRVYFDHNGSGHLLVNYGTPTRSDVIEFANGKAAIEFATGEGRTVIEARNQDFKGSYLVIPGEKIELNLLGIERDRILQKANRYLNEQPITITAAYCPRSAGGVHDYYSEGDYWWPNADDPDGPYIRRDGMTNPDNFTDHREFMRRMSIQVAALAAAYKITGDNKYAVHAIRHLRAWFLDDSTKMNPHLKYAQAIKGISKGRGVGIIDTIHLVEVARAISLLQNSPAMSAKDLAGIKNWFAEYLLWMTTSENGIDERERKNNHGTCWVMQVAEFSRLTGNKYLMDYCRDRFKTVLLPNQMADNGSFPLELERTKPYGYSLFNLDALAMVCQILSIPEDNLWTFQLPDGRGMKKAMEFMVPFIEDKSKWQYPPDVMYFDEWPVRHPSLLFAGLALNEPKYIDLWKKLKPEPATEEGLRNFPIRQVVLWIDVD
jgi:beta-galactosidase